MKFHQKLLLCVGKERHTELVIIYVMMLFMAGFEMLCAMMFLPFLAVLEAPENIANYAWAKHLLDDLGYTDHTSVIIFFCVLLLGAYVFKNVFALFYKYKQAHFTRTSHEKLAVALLRQYLKDDYIKHLSRHSADLIRNINQDTNSIFSNVMRPVLSVSVEMIIAAGLLGLLLYQSFTTTIFAVGSIGVLGAVVYKLSQRYTYQYGRTTRMAMGQMIQWTIQALGSIKETKVMNKEDYFLSRYEQSASTYKDTSVKYAVTHEIPRLSMEVLGIFAVLVMTLVLITTSSIAEALPTLGLFAVAAFRLLPSLTRMISGLSLVKFHRSALDRVVDDLTSPQPVLRRSSSSSQTETPSKPLEFEHTLSFDRISFSYDPGQQPVIEECSLTIQKGQTVAFVGTSGAGKTTLIDLLLGLLTPDAGEIKVDGTSIQDDLPAWQKHVGYISQPTYMLNDTIARNVAFGLFDEEIDEERVWHVLEQAQLKSTIEALPDQLQNELGESGVKMSGGQRQRIGIARVLYHNPEILVFDEATSALDNETEAEITHAIQTLSKTKTIILIAHRFSTIKHCDQIFVLDKGSVLSQGTYEELYETCPTFHRLATASTRSAS